MSVRVHSQDPSMATSERRLADNVWDLRDDAHDHPERWAGVTVEAVLRRLAAFVEEAEKRGDRSTGGKT